jgi:hypothetical protein
VGGIGSSPPEPYDGDRDDEEELTWKCWKVKGLFLPRSKKGAAAVSGSFRPAIACNYLEE